ncbi:MAG TPA: MAPEG family protein [Nevskiaceae bacterium]|nr:MAPEG family protein [Nevskiaceae bacterium]
MSQSAVFAPVLALTAWTLLILLLMAVRRIRAVGRKEIKASDFRSGESAQVPYAVSIVNRNYMNLLEVPVLFYVTCIVLFDLHATTATIVAIAWLYVALRIAHSLIHLSYNNVWHRVTVFALSNATLLALWGIAVYRL